jgi:hypothetical protein
MIGSTALGRWFSAELAAPSDLHLLEAATSRKSLRELMDTVGKQAEERGLTEERLQELLREAEDARTTNES